MEYSLTAYELLQTSTFAFFSETLLEEEPGFKTQLRIDKFDAHLAKEDDYILIETSDPERTAKLEALGCFTKGSYETVGAIGEFSVDIDLPVRKTSYWCDTAGYPLKVWKSEWSYRKYYLVPKSEQNPLPKIDGVSDDAIEDMMTAFDALLEYELNALLAPEKNPIDPLYSPPHSQVLLSAFLRAGFRAFSQTNKHSRPIKANECPHWSDPETWKVV